MAPSGHLIDQWHGALCWLLIGAGAMIMPLLLVKNISALYGRYADRSRKQQKNSWWGPMLNGKLAWMTQEMPSLLAPLAVALMLPPPRFQLSAPRTWLTAAYTTHYVYRSLVYPRRLRGGKGTALAVWAAAVTFCTWNGFLQGWFLLHQMAPAQAWCCHHVLGLLLWLVGWLSNLQADGILRDLRATTGDTGYKIPHGGLFESVSAANYTAETLEWLGYAMAGWSLAPAAFAWATVANLAPRAASHHKWYKAKFGEKYPSCRKAYIPHIW